MQNSKILLHGFRSLLPQYQKPQVEALKWLAMAHSKAEGWIEPESELARPERMEKLFSRFGCKPSQVERRFSVLSDYTHGEFDRMEIFNLSRNPKGAGSSARTALFARSVCEAFDEFYRSEISAPSAMLHVTCTGYDSPSGAEKIVARKGWGNETEVYHLYHMGCYAAIPAVKIAEGLAEKRTDIIHTELCSIHLDPTLHSPEQMVIQSLFSDGLIRYVAERDAPAGTPGFKLLTTRKELVPNSEEAMTWSMGDHGMMMSLSRKVPDLIASSLYPFLERLTLWDDDTIFAIHPGGPRIVDQVQDLLRLSDRQVAASRDVLKSRGNMSSATLPHVWMNLLADDGVSEGTRIVSLAFGPGLTLCGNVLRKTRA